MILHDGRLRWYDADLNLHCIPAPDSPALYPSEAAAFADITAKHAGIPADWSRDL